MNGPATSSDSAPRTGRPTARGTLALALLATALLAPVAARAQCSCPSGGVPLLDSVKTRGNDLNELRGHCAPRNGTIELQAYQRHLLRREICPPRCPAKEMWGWCIDQCEWTTVAQTTADGLGYFRFGDLDAQRSVQVISAWPGEGNGLDGVYTAFRVRAWDPETKAWSAWTDPPSLEGFNVNWPGYEGGFAQTETRISGAERVHVVVADGPDDGDDPAIALDVDEDTPNFWLQQNRGGTVEYLRSGVCDVRQGCALDWLVLQSPSVNVQSPPLARGSEYPYVLGMVTASRPGAMFVATSVFGKRDIADISVQVDVDVNVDLSLGLDFSSLF
jgi:hypothetical protein